MEKAFDFKGCAKRSTFWWVVLANIIIGFALGLLGSVGTIASTIYSIATLIPGLAIVFRRLHDTGRSGWNLLRLLLPIVGWIILIVYLASSK